MELKLPTAEQLKAVYDRDLTASFPPAELKPLRNIQSMERDGWYRPWCLFDGDEIVGEAFLWLGNPGWALLDYLCVSPGRRDCGLGAEILSAVRRAEGSGTVILWESEAPVHAPDPALARRRLDFYCRNGARAAGYDTEIFGVHYKTLYLAPAEIPDSSILREHRYIYQSRFPRSKYEQYVHIPRDPAAEPGRQVPWNEDEG